MKIHRILFVNTHRIAASEIFNTLRVVPVDEKKTPEKHSKEASLTTILGNLRKTTLSSTGNQICGRSFFPAGEMRFLLSHSCGSHERAKYVRRLKLQFRSAVRAYPPRRIYPSLIRPPTAQLSRQVDRAGPRWFITASSPRQRRGGLANPAVACRRIQQTPVPPSSAPVPSRAAPDAESTSSNAVAKFRASDVCVATSRIHASSGTLLADQNHQP